MNDKEFAVEKIRSQYTEKAHSELDALKALDAKVKKPANVFGYTYGSIGTIVMGAGMSLVLPNDKSVKYIPEAVEVVIGDLCDEASLEPFSPMEWLEEDISFSSVGRSSAVCRLLRRTSLCVFEWP